MRGGVAVLAGGLALVVFVGIAAAGPPLVSAGLDQDVTQGDPVYLDAGGTHVPDGNLASLEWSIETPNGSTIDPNCVDCEVTWFRANQAGQYEVRLTAESASGVERSDAMYVSVSRWSATSSSSVSNVSASGGGGGSSGCWVAHEGDSGGPMDQGVCSAVGRHLGIEWMSEDIKGIVLNDSGFARRYSVAEFTEDGNIIVPTFVFSQETTSLYEEWNSNSGRDIIDNSDERDQSRGTSGPPNDNRPTEIVGEGNNGIIPPSDSCNAPCGAKS